MQQILKEFSPQTWRNAYLAKSTPQSCKSQALNVSFQQALVVNEKKNHEILTSNQTCWILILLGMWN